MKLVRKEVAIGACVLIALAILFFGIEYLKGVSVFRPANYYYAVYNNVNGLAVSDPVYVSGFKIGQVEDVELMYGRGGKVLVTLNLDKNFKVPVGSSAVIESSLLGTGSIRIDLSDATQFYASGDTIEGRSAASLMDNVSESLLPSVGSVIPHADSLLVNVNSLVSDPSLINTLRNVEAISASLRTTAAVLNATMTHMPAMMSHIDSIAADATRIAENLRVLTSNLSEAPIDETLANINAITADLAALTDALDNPDGNIGRLLNTPDLYQNIVQATADIDSLLVDIRRNPKRYISIKLL